MIKSWDFSQYVGKTFSLGWENISITMGKEDDKDSLYLGSRETIKSEYYEYKRQYDN